MHLQTHSRKLEVAADSLRSFIDVAPNSDFPIQNLPYGAFTPPEAENARIGVAIGEYVLDLSVLAERGLLRGDAQEHGYFGDSVLNRFMARGCEIWSATRRRITELLSDSNTELKNDDTLREKSLHRIDSVKLHMPIKVEEYTDFYSSIHHAQNVGALLRPEQPLLPNWRHLPISYQGSARSIVVSGTPIQRPNVQSCPPGAEVPVFGPERQLDFELELAFLIGKSGKTITCSNANDYIFGAVLLNDWSARSNQKCSGQPLGPSASKKYATSISPWVVTLDALAPFTVDAEVQTPQPLSYLQSSRQVFDISLEVAVRTPEMKPTEEYQITQTNSKFLYWDHTQQLACHSHSYPVNVGDIFATGTISGSSPKSLGCLLEITKGGKENITLPNGAVMTFLRDGDSVVMRGWAQRGDLRIGFGAVDGTILPAAKLA
ncbi:MAG: fumarylacetoacetase [Pseudomonadota bacterium]